MLRLISAALVLLLASACEAEQIEVLPDFTQYSGVEKKQAFFNYLRPQVEQANQAVLEQRALLLALSRSEKLTAVDRQWLKQLSQQYRVNYQANKIDFAALLRRVDAVPVELALTQAAIESAWGTSRFARLGNNLFGQWCRKAGCGIVPLRRAAGASHEVKRFESTEDSVKAYLRNLNSHRAYQPLRARRAALRKAQQPVTASALALTLDKYSERGNAYVQDMLRFIKHNRSLMQETP